MKIEQLYSLVFSPAGHTRVAVEAVLLAWEEFSRSEIDLSDRNCDFSVWNFAPSDLCLVAVPAFGGRAPGLAIEHLTRMRGNQTPVVILASYGNRAYEDTLIEVKNTLERRGFVVIAAIATVAEHTIVPQIASGRPSMDDLTELRAFGDKIRELLEKSDVPVSISVPGNIPYRFYGGIPLKPVANRTCTKCRLCAERCPTGAIPSAVPNQTDRERCISCMRCVAICPVKARALPRLPLWLVGRKLKKLCAIPKKNELFGCDA